MDQARFGWADDRQGAFNEALAAADRGLEIDPNYGELYSVISYACIFQRRFDEATDAAEKAVAASPNSVSAFHMSAMTHIYAGNFETGRDYEEQAGRLSPIDLEVSLVDLARAQYHLGQYEEARRLAGRVLQKQPRWLTAQTILVSALWRLGREDEAHAAAATITRTQPKFSIARWAAGWPYRRTEDLAALMDPLREARLPE